MLIRILVILYCSFLTKVYAGTFTLQVKKPNHSILLRTHKEILEFRPNASLHWGVKISGDAFYIEYGGKIKDTNYGKSQVGNNSYKSYRIGIPIKNTYTELYLQEWIGFSSDENSDTGCEYCLDRENLSSRERSAHFLYAIDSDFSMKALNSNGSSGVQWKTSPLLTIFYNRLKFRDFGGLLQGDSNNRFPFFANLTSLEMRQVGLGIGYGLLAPLGPVYMGVAGIIGAGYQNNIREDLNGIATSNTGIGTHWSFKAMVASHNPNFNLGLKGFLFSNIYDVDEESNAASLNYNLYLYASYTW